MSCYSWHDYHWVIGMKCDKFAQTNDLTRIKTFGIPINPHSRLGKIGYGLAIVLILPFWSLSYFLYKFS